MNEDQIQELAQQLTNARTSVTPVVQLSSTLKDWTEQDAYKIQKYGIGLREQAGEKVIGMKMGLTSEAKRKQMNLDSPLYGVLTDKMEVKDGGTFILKNGIHPKIEPEVAFFIEKDLKVGCNHDDVLHACSGVCASLEILDSRYTEFKYFSLEDVISDNSSSSHYVLGPKLSGFENLKIADLKMTMKVNGEVAHAGNSSAISGDPVKSVIQLTELLAKSDQYIKAPCVVLAGAATAAVQLEQGMHITLDVEGLASLGVHVGE